MNKHSYRWIILLLSFIIMAVPFSIVNTIHTLFMQPVTSELNISLAAFSLLFSLSAVINAALSPLMGRAVEKVPLRLLMGSSGIVVGGGFALYGMADTIGSFYLLAAFIAAGMTGLTTIPVSTMLTNWFEQRRGMAIGIAFAGMGMGTFCWMSLTAQLITDLGYAAAYKILGLLIIVVVLPLCLFVRLRPEAAVIKSPTSSHKESMLSLLQDRNIRHFGVGLALLGLTAAGIQLHVQSYLALSGFALTHNARIGSIIALAGIIWNIIIGLALDRLTPKRVLKLTAAISAAAIGLLFFFQYAYAHYSFAILVGAMLSMAALWPTYGVGCCFHQYNYAAVLGLLNLCFVSGAALGPTLSGLLADTSIGYNGAWLIYLICLCSYTHIFIKALKRVG